MHGFFKFGISFIMKKYLLIIIISSALQSCLNFEITKSPERFEEPHVILLENDVKLVSFGSVTFFKSDFFPASFMIESKENVVYIDPLLVDSIKKADYIFITHAHMDHLYMPDIEKISNEETLIICPKKAAKKLNDYNVKIVKPGDKLEFGEVIFETYPSYSKGFPTHPKSNENVSCVITMNGVRFFHSGDSDLIPEIQGIKNIDVAMLPIDGGMLTMKTDEATKLVNTMKPKKAIPMHYKINKGKTAEFRRLVNKGIEVIVLEE